MIQHFQEVLFKNVYFISSFLPDKRFIFSSQFCGYVCIHRDAHLVDSHTLPQFPVFFQCSIFCLFSFQRLCCLLCALPSVLSLQIITLPAPSSHSDSVQCQLCRKSALTIPWRAAFYLFFLLLSTPWPMTSGRVCQISLFSSLHSTYNYLKLSYYLFAQCLIICLLYDAEKPLRGGYLSASSSLYSQYQAHGRQSTNICPTT